MKITTTHDAGFCIVKIDGRIDTTNFNEFENELIELIDSGEIKIILNCSGLNYISSSGLRVFLIAQKKILALNGLLYLSDMQSSIKEIFNISGFSTIFQIFPTQQDALK